MAIVYEKDTGTALVRIHSGELSKEEWEERLRKAAAEFFKAIRPELERLGKMDQYTMPVPKGEGQILDRITDNK